jgi:diguanylate cyclase (GGDEF)-like protein
LSLDFQTLLVCYALTRVLQAVGLVYVWQVHRRYAPLRELAAGSVMVAFGSLSLTSLEPGSGTLAVLQTLMLATGSVVFNVGLVRLSDRPPPWMLAIGWAAACIVAREIAIFIWPSAIAGVLVTTLFYVGCLAYSTVALLRVPPGPMRVTQLVIAGLLIVQMAGVIERAMVLLAQGVSAPAVLLQSSAAQTTFLLAAMGSAFLLTLSIAVLANQRLQQALDAAASIDPLTGLMNRRAFSQIAERDWARALRGNRRLSMLLIDLDHFKSFNDRYGHKVGDAVLRKVADTLAKEVRLTDVVCRFGGEEFIVLMPDTAANEAALVAERLRVALGALHEDQAPDLPVSASIGVAERSLAEAHWEQLVAVADKALYAAKQAGRNRVEVADVLRRVA